VAARRVAVGTDQQQSPRTVPRKRPPDETQDRDTSIGSFQFHMVVRSLGVVRIKVATQPNSFFDFAVMSLVLPDQQIGDSARIVEIASHNPRGDDRHVFAVEPRPVTDEMPVPSVPLISLSHRLIPVTGLSIKIPLGGCAFKESVKVCTPKSPLFSYDFSPEFAAFYVFPHCSCAQTEEFGGFSNGIESIFARERYEFIRIFRKNPQQRRENLSTITLPKASAIPSIVEATPDLPPGINITDLQDDAALL